MNSSTSDFGVFWCAMSVARAFAYQLGSISFGKEEEEEEEEVATL